MVGAMRDARATRPEMPKDYGVPDGQEGMVDWQHAAEVLASAKMYWVGTVRPDGRPHAVPVWGAFVDGTLYLETGGHDTVKVRNIKANPRVVVHVERGDDVVIVEGTAEEVDVLDDVLFGKIADSFAARYGGYRPETPRGSFVIRPAKAFAWNEFPKTPTRFFFAGSG